MKREYLHTFTLELGLLVTQILVYRFAATYWGPVGFGEYALGRRAIAIMHPAVMLGTGIALPRMLAWEAGSTEARQKGFLAGAVGIVATALGVVTLPLILVPDRMGALIFGQPGQAPLARALAVALAGVCLHVVTYAYLRGRFRLRVANWLQFVVLGLIPAAVFLIPDQSVAQLIFRAGLATGVVAGGALGAQLITGPAPDGIGVTARRLAGFGVTRLPADFLHMLLLSVPSIVVAHRAGVEAGGQAAFALSLVIMAGSVFAPIGLVLLPHASRLAAAGSRRELRRHVQRLAVGTAAAGVVMTLIGELVAPVAIAAYLGPRFDDAVPIVRLCLLAVPPYALFVTLRSALEAVDERAVNARNLAIAVGAGALAVGLGLAAGGSTAAILAAVVAAITLLGVLTLASAVARVTRGPE